MWVFLYLILVHWVADFVLQSRQMGEKKGKDNFWLTVHVSVYTFTTILSWVFLFYNIDIPMTSLSIWQAFIAIFTLHWFTDYVTSKITGKFYSQQKWYGFFTTIGFDQVLHYVQLFTIYTYIILNK